MLENRSAAAKRIAKKILENSKGTGESYCLNDLIDYGVDGDLLIEVIEILERADFIVDMKVPSGLEEALETNIRECLSLLQKRYDRKTEQELFLLREEPKVFLGCKFDRLSDTKLSADSGLPLMSRRFASSSSYLMRFPMRGPLKDVIIIDDKVVSFDADKYNHKLFN